MQQELEKSGEFDFLSKQVFSANEFEIYDEAD
jgi:hypothetical protein